MSKTLYAIGIGLMNAMKRIKKGPAFAVYHIPALFDRNFEHFEHFTREP
jgi:hypothetical protein